MSRPIGLIPACLLACRLFAMPAAAADFPYGMDPVPPSVFDPDAWDRYGSDPVPSGVTSDLGFRDVYGLDAIPAAVVPTLHELRHVLPHQTLEVLTKALEDGGPAGIGASRAQPSRPETPPAAPCPRGFRP